MNGLECATPSPLVLGPARASLDLAQYHRERVSSATSRPNQGSTLGCLLGLARLTALFLGAASPAVALVIAFFRHGFDAVTLAVLTGGVCLEAAMFVYYLRRAERRTARERAVAESTSNKVADLLGAEDAIKIAAIGASLPAGSGAGAAIPIQSTQADSPSVSETTLSEEVDLHVARAMARLESSVLGRLGDQAETEAVKNRLRAIEERLPDPKTLPKGMADANQLFLAYQVGELNRRIERIEGRLPSRQEIAGIGIGVLVAGVGLVAGIIELLRVMGLLK